MPASTGLMKREPAPRAYARASTSLTSTNGAAASGLATLDTDFDDTLVELHLDPMSAFRRRAHGEVGGQRFRLYIRAVPGSQLLQRPSRAVTRTEEEPDAVGDGKS